MPEDKPQGPAKIVVGGKEFKPDGTPAGEKATAPSADLQAKLDAVTKERDDLSALVGNSDVNLLRQDSAAYSQVKEALGGELLPADFPGRNALFGDRRFTPAHLAGLDKAALTNIKGVGDKTADDILAALKGQ